MTNYMLGKNLNGERKKTSKLYKASNKAFDVRLLKTYYIFLSDSIMPSINFDFY